MSASPAPVQSAGIADSGAASGIDWSTMRPSDFDSALKSAAPLALVDADEVPRPVLAVPHASGTAALFGDEPPASRTARRGARPAAAPSHGTGALF